jgi:hypothetical protein
MTKRRTRHRPPRLSKNWICTIVPQDTVSMDLSSPTCMQESEQNPPSKMNQHSNSPTETRGVTFAASPGFSPLLKSTTSPEFTPENWTGRPGKAGEQETEAPPLCAEAKNKTEKQTKGTAALLSEAAKLKSDAWLGTRWSEIETCGPGVTLMARGWREFQLKDGLGKREERV